MKMGTLESVARIIYQFYWSYSWQEVKTDERKLYLDLAKKIVKRINK